MNFIENIQKDKIYKPSDICYLLDNLPTIKHNHTLYYNIPCAFDTESCSFYQDGEKRAVMYGWTFAINGYVILGRTYEELTEMLEYISNALGLMIQKKHLVIYVHNLAWDYQYIHKWFNFEKVFSISERKPIYAITDTGLEFRCSYILTNKSLAKVSSELQCCHFEKLIGDLDYELIRHQKTLLTDSEKGYMVNDVKIVSALIYDKIHQDGDISKIPLTNTGYVRRFCRDMCFYNPGEKKSTSRKRQRYLENYIRTTTIQDADEFEQLKRAFQGGYTHANPYWVAVAKEGYEQ